MKKMSVYIEGGTWIHKQSPVSKMLYAGLVIAASFLGHDLKVSLFFFCFSVFLLFWAGVLKQFLKFCLAVTVVLVSIMLINGLFFVGNKTVVWQIGGVSFYYEGLMHAATIALRMLNLIAAIAVLTFTSKPERIIYSLVQSGMPYRWGYMLGAVLQAVPHMTNLLKITLDAQKARGIDTEGKLFARLRALFPAFMPVVIMSLLSVKDRALALEVRGFANKNKKTFLHSYKERAWDKFCQTCLLFATIIVILYY